MHSDDWLSFADDSRLLDTFQRLLALPSIALRPTLNAASTLVAEVMGADKVDIFLYQSNNATLVALGTSETPLGQKEQELGLDRFPLSDAGPMARVYETGEAYRTGHADQDPSQPRGVVEDLGVRSEVDVPVGANGE